MSKHVLTVIVAVIIGVSLLLYMFAFQVRESEKVVVLRFGKPAAAQPEPGYHFKWPWPIEEVRRFDARIHVSEGKIEETRTKDGQNIIVSLCVGWKVADPQIFNQNFGRVDPDKQEEEAWGRIESIVRDRTLATLGNYDLGQLVNVESDKLQYDQIESEIKQKVSATLGPAGYGVKDFGIEIALAKIRRLELPATLTNSVYERMKAERGLEAEKYRSDGTQKAAVIVGRAESQRDQILARAQSEAERLRGEGDAEAATYYKAFDQNPDLAIYLVKIRALRTAAKGKTTLIVDTSMPPFDLLIQGPPELKASGTPAAEKQLDTPKTGK